MGSKGLDEKIREFEEALHKYKHLYIIELPIEQTVEVERIQLEIIESLREEALKSIRESVPLEEFASRLVEEGEAEKHYYAVLEGITGANEPSFEEAVEQVDSGAYDKPGAAALLLMLQAVARAYAESYEELYGKGAKGGSDCPICKARSDIMYREQDGSYYMLCPFCFYVWKVSDEKLVCPHCGSRDEVGLGIYSDKAMRVGLLHCQDCGGTTKVILDKAIRAPRPVLPLIALSAEKFRPFLSESTS